MKVQSIALFLVCSLFFSFAGEQKIIFKKPTNWPEPHSNFKANPLTPEKVELGRALFYDPVLSRDGRVSCASCHLSYTAFTHVDHALSHGIEDRIGTRNSPALMNLAWSKSLMWDGSVNHLDMVALAPIHNPLEMDETIDHVVEKLRKSPNYPRRFAAAFSDSSVTGERTLKAISQFLLTLVSANARYDSVMRNETAFTSQEQNGYALFQKNCNSCHTEPLFTNSAFENNGLALDTGLKDFGRMAITKRPSDSLKFKIPTLRNIAFSTPYMHDGRFKKLSQVLHHYTFGIQKSATLAPALEKPIVLSSNEKADLIAFLLTLSDRNFLFDPKHSHPKLTASSP